MTTVNGLPSHVLLVHFIVVLAPLTALLAIDPWAVKMRAQTRRYYHIDETHIDDLADDPADEGQP